MFWWILWSVMRVPVLFCSHSWCSASWQWLTGGHGLGPVAPQRFLWVPSPSVSHVHGRGRQVEIPPLYSAELAWHFLRAGTYDIFFTLNSQVKFWKNNPALQPSVLTELLAPDSLPPRGLVTAHSLVSGCRVCGREGSQERITKIRPSFILQYGFPFSWLFGGAGQEKDKASPLQWQPSLSITWELLGDVALC